MKTFILLRTIALLAIPSAAGATNSGVQPRLETQSGFHRTEGPRVVELTSFAGTWATGRRCVPYTVVLTQVGNQVTGTYSPGNGKISEGVVTDNTLRFKWTEDGGSGEGEFIMGFDGKNFTGTSSAINPRGFIVAWNTITPPVIPFAGQWQTYRDGSAFPLTMVQSGNHVMGLYEGNGKLDGTISDRVLRFKWQSDRGAGSGRFIMEEKNFSFSGSYNRGSNPDDVEATWSGKSTANPDVRAPRPCDPLGYVLGDPGNKRPEGGSMPMDKAAEAEYAKKVAEYEEAQRNAPAGFDGVWHAKFGDGLMELILQQPTARDVTGQLRVNSADFGVVKEGIVDRNTLRFQLWRAGKKMLPNGLNPTVYAGTGELVMGTDGKSFSGTILGVATTGVRIAR